MPKTIFVNLPVADVERSAGFYEGIGFTRDERFSRPGSAAAMTWSDTIVFMILSREHFADGSRCRVGRHGQPAGRTRLTLRKGVCR